LLFTSHRVSPRPIRAPGVGLFWDKNIVGWLLVPDLFWEKSNASWCLVSQTNTGIWRRQ
jgi:hypothetical protein